MPQKRTTSEILVAQAPVFSAQGSAKYIEGAQQNPRRFEFDDR